MSQGPDHKKPLGRIALQQRPVIQPKSEVTRAAQPSSQPTDVEALKALSEQFGVPGIDLQQVCVRLADLELVPREIAERQAILPVLVRDDRIFVAMGAPGDSHTIDEIEFVTGKKVYPYVALPSDLERAVSAAYDLKSRGEDFYVAPHCPLETQEHMGAVTARQETEEEGLQQDEGVRQVQTAVVVDDATDHAASFTDLSVAADMDVSEELSVVTDLPGTQPTVSMVGRAGARTILIVDDEIDIRKMLARLLSDRGFNVIEAERGLQALRIVKDNIPDLIILDAMLPEVHGFEIARRIKGSERYGHIPIIMISAVYRGWRYAEDAKTSYGVEAYIEKPFRIAEILKTIDELAERGGGAEQDHAPPEETSSRVESALSAGVAAYQAGDLDGAIEHLRQGVAVDPLAYRLHFHLGLLSGKKGLIYEAIQHLERALQINSRHFPAMKNLAVLYQKAGFRNKAIETWERAIAVAPDEATRQSIKELLLGLL